MGPVQIILGLLLTIAFLFVLYKVLYEKGPLSLKTIPTISEIKKNVAPDTKMCDVSKLGTLVTYEGNPLEGSNIMCQECTSYLSLMPSGSCKTIDNSCNLVGEQSPCPFR